MELDKLRRVETRAVWPHEAHDFTPWLALDENFQALAETLHFIDAEVDSVEHSVGDFSADIVGHDRDGTILIENQLEQTDHTHLGQILTYLGGLDGSVKIVWVATKIREEHRAAVDWLNAHTSDDFAFFAVELEVFRIGGGPAAPHFHVAARPNAWSRHVTARARQLSEGALDERQQRYRSFWTAWMTYLSDKDTSLASMTPPKGHWWQFQAGRTHFAFSLSANKRDSLIGVELYCGQDEDKAVFEHFLADKDAIEAELGEPLEWERLDGKKASRLVVKKRDIDPDEEAVWPSIFEWYWPRLQKFRSVFEPRVKALDLDALSGPPLD